MAKTVTPAYRYMPDLTSEEEQGLRTSIGEHGVLQPVLTDERGVIIDGHNRARIAAELGIEYESRAVPGLSAEGVADLAFSANMAKRHLTSQQKRDVIGRYLTVRPEATDRHAATVLGVHHQTVASVRAELHPPNGENPHKDNAPDGTLAAPFYRRQEASGRRPRGRQPDSPAVRASKAIARRQAQTRAAEEVIASTRAAIAVPVQAQARCSHNCALHCPPASSNGNGSSNGTAR